MPKEYLDCIRRGGRVRTISGPNIMFNLKKGEYRHICFLDGKMSLGEKKQKEIKKAL